ncbi:hypothetical protein N7493_006546 [Penicillium malachiteum]|uniref:Major facilitator superfamily (MFS) profile domain-containing protein n=1 Tax=Penicillium malachiteum TaxID=1324776 RepID=A0AAD6MVP3_9EURO|nr:hypothetical protein N7493_006546 [Penicillium malachiteum]
MAIHMEMQSPVVVDLEVGETYAKQNMDFVESAGNVIPDADLPTEIAQLSKPHRDYLLERHGTLNLDPIPAMDPADPYNWPEWKKTMNLILVAFHACMGTFAAAGIIPAYSDITEIYGVSTQSASYLTSLQIAVLGGAPLFWKPLSHRYGRRPIFLISLIVSLVFNIGCAKTKTYGATAACRALSAFFISPASAIGSAVVMETTFKKDRARYMGIWTVMITLGVPLGPFIFGFVAYRAGYEWIYWVLAIINAVQFILYLFFGPETRYVDSGEWRDESTFKREYLSVRRIDPTPFTWFEFVKPLTLFTRPCILIPTCAYAMIFLFCNIMTTVEIPSLLQSKFDLNTEQVGLQFLGMIIGSIIGEQMGGNLSDYWMRMRAKRGQAPAPEFRLWLSYFGFALSCVGVIIFLICTQEAPSGHWSAPPIVGTGIAAAGSQLVTTVMVTYAMDCYPQEAASVGVFITFVRQIWGFLGPFWFPSLFDTVGVAASAGVVCGMIVAVSILPTMAVQAFGKKWRQRHDEVAY